jgi:hypothetical protein
MRQSARITWAFMVSLLITALGATQPLAGPGPDQGSTRRPHVKTITTSGWVSDAACGAQHTRAGGADCVRKCIRGGASIGHPEWKPQELVFVLDEDQTISMVANPEVLRGYEGKHLLISAAMDPALKRLRVIEIKKEIEETR